MQTPFLESQPSSRQDRLKKNRSKSSSTIAKKQKAKKAVSASKVKHKPSYDSAYESSSTHDYASVQASPSIQSDQLAPVEPADAELVSPEVYNSWQTPDPQEQTSVHFDDPFASTALPTDARSTFFLHHFLTVLGPSRALCRRNKWRSPILQFARRTPEAIGDRLVYGSILYNSAVHYSNCFGQWKALPETEDLGLDCLSIRATLYSDLNEALRDPSRASSDNTLCALAHLLYTEAQHPAPSNARQMHRQGLDRLVTLRGGLAAIPPRLARFIASTASMYCITEDKPPEGPLFASLPITTSPLPKTLKTTIKTASAEKKAFFSLDILFFIHPDIVGAARDLYAVLRVPTLEKSKDLPMPELMGYDWMLERVVKRLLEAKKTVTEEPMLGNLDPDHQEMCRQALLIFAYTSLSRLQNGSFWVSRILLQRLEAATMSAKRGGSIDLPADVLIWILFMGVYCEDEGRTPGFLLSLLVPKVREQEFGSFEEFESLLVTFLYATDVHQPTARKVWEQAA